MIDKKTLENIQGEIRKAITTADTSKDYNDSIDAYKTLLTHYYTHIETTGGRTVEQTVKQNISCGSCKSSIKNYWNRYLSAYGY